jgi:translocation and assembly module TamA
MTISEQATAAGSGLKRQAYCILLLLCLLLCPGLTAIAGADPIEIVIEGVDGDLRKNILEALTLPYGLVKDNQVDRLWLERFVRQADQKVLAALEPFGYYSARVVIQIEAPEAEKYRLRVQVDTGQPVILSDVSVSVTGRGATEAPLLALAAAFPLQKGSVLSHPVYEQAKLALQSRAEELGYLDVEYTVHEIRIDEAARFARIILVLQTGERYFFSDVALEGAPDYPDAFLRHYLTFKP